VPGPVPNREEDLARPRERKGSDQMSVTRGVSRPVTIPHADKEWHPIARSSGTPEGLRAADFYEQSDWALAYSICDDLSEYKKSSRRSSQMAQTIYSAMTNLLVTEADRRRVRIELHEPGRRRGRRERDRHQRLPRRTGGRPTDPGVMPWMLTARGDRGPGAHLHRPHVADERRRLLASSPSARSAGRSPAGQRSGCATKKADPGSSRPSRCVSSSGGTRSMSGRFVYRKGVLQRMKGWGKDPLLAVICLVELVGPSAC
jgi:hypothetical protein